MFWEQYLTGIGHNLFVQPASSSLIAWDGRCPRQVERNTCHCCASRHRVRYYVIRDVFDIYFDAIDLRFYVIRYINSLVPSEYV